MRVWFSCVDRAILGVVFTHHGSPHGEQIQLQRSCFDLFIVVFRFLFFLVVLLQIQIRCVISCQTVWQHLYSIARMHDHVIARVMCVLFSFVAIVCLFAATASAAIPVWACPETHAGVCIDLLMIDFPRPLPLASPLPRIFSQWPYWSKKSPL